MLPRTWKEWVGSVFIGITLYLALVVMLSFG